MRGVSKEVTMNIFWIIFAIVAVTGIFIMGQFVFSLLQPVDVGTEASGISFDGEKGTVCFDADPAKTDCRRCKTVPLWGTCEKEQYVSIEEKFGSVLVKNVTTCGIASLGPRQETDMTFKVLYEDDKKRTKTKTAYRDRETCHTFNFEDVVLLKEVAASIEDGNLDRFTVEFVVQGD